MSRLLYLSKIGTPYDAAAGKGTLGKNLTHQVEGNTRVFFDKPLNAFMGTGGLAMRISDFDGDHGLNGSEGLLRMGMIGVLSQREPSHRHVRRHAREARRKRIGDRNGRPPRSNGGTATRRIALSGEHLSYRQNFMDLDPTYTDKFGDPLLRFTLDWTDHEHRQRSMPRKSRRRSRPRWEPSSTEAPGRPRAATTSINYQSTHIQGGAVMGTVARDRASSTGISSTGTCRICGCWALRHSRRMRRTIRR